MRLLVIYVYLLFDEPFANLDAKFRDNARVELRRLIDRFKATMIYVTHDQIEAMVLADRIILMNDGHIEQVGTHIFISMIIQQIFLWQNLLAHRRLTYFRERCQAGCGMGR